ncbi:MAG TPA: hypothetical protein DCM28_09860 [Phycisphaerales bacterium]|nr:hypothetical protein [Phycisphaerales bacterium]HCD33904.1 hypothetical protein [Phycisphaerales bacterium]|tara:strand:+ start:13428 stop:14555 length:1128 start_codon:yes stop_codon:yes gene_type:complete
MYFKLSVCLLCLGLLAPFSQITLAQTDGHEGHNHPKGEPHTDSQIDEPEQKPLPPLSKQQLIDQVLTGRSILKDQRLTALHTFTQQVEKAESDLTDKDQRPVYDQLLQGLNRNIQFITDNQYVSAFAGTEESFAIEPLSEAHKTYKDALDKAAQDYATVVAKALRRDDEGHLGTWVKSDLDNAIDTELMAQLMDWYWHHGHVDVPPGSFDSIIKLTYRYVQLEPTAGTMYCNAAWLLWSRWVSWKQDPEKMPVGENDDQTAIKFLIQGRKACIDDAAYHHEAAMTVWGLARFHNRDYFNFILDSLHLAEKAVKPDNQWLHIRIRLTLGHTYRQLDDLDNALKAYRTVLELDPDQEVAKRIIDELENPSKASEKQI